MPLKKIEMDDNFRVQIELHCCQNIMENLHCRVPGSEHIVEPLMHRRASTS